MRLLFVKLRHIGDALLLTAACVVCGVVLLQATRRLWTDRG